MLLANEINSSQVHVLDTNLSEDNSSYARESNSSDINTTFSIVTDINATAQIDTKFLQDENTSDTNTSEENYLDAFHKRASDHVIRLSGFADEKLVKIGDFVQGKEYNITQDEKSITEKNKDSVDSFFLSDKYLDQTNKSFISIRPDAKFSSKAEEEYNLKISASLAFSKSKKRFRLFVNELDQDNAKDVISEEENERTAPELGMNYFAPETYGVQSKYSLGVQGIYPFARARYSTSFEPGEWIIEPVQTLRYSLKDYFEESTQLFFDTKMTDTSLFRLYLSRGTKSSTPGMSYDNSITLFFSPTKDTGLRLSQFVSGSTKYQHSQDLNAVPIIYEEYSGIFNHGTKFSIRQNFYRKWLFYELEPGVNFHKQYDFEPNYSIRLFFDIFFGNF